MATPDTPSSTELDTPAATEPSATPAATTDTTDTTDTTATAAAATADP